MKAPAAAIAAPNPSNVYICLISTGVGGTEKRTIELWELFQARGWTNIHLVISRHSYRLLTRLPDLRYLREGNPSLIILECHTPISFLPPIVRLALKAPAGSVFHYPLQALPFVHKLLGQRLMMSYTANTFFQHYAGGVRRKLLFRMQASGAERIDVLNPLNFEQFKRRRSTRDKVVLNPGSFVDLDRFPAEAHKQNWIAFAGRFAEGDPKNAIRFVDAIPEIHEQLAHAGVPDPKFVLMGDGVLESKMRAMLSEDRYRGIDVSIRFEQSPAEVLKYSKVFVSVQKESNYPSKSLLEALACGNLPVVTDVGETRLIAAPEFSAYVPENFSAQQLAAAIVSQFKLDHESWSSRVRTARDFLRHRYDISAHYDHYLRLYGLAPQAAGSDKALARTQC